MTPISASLTSLPPVPRRGPAAIGGGGGSFVMHSIPKQVLPRFRNQLKPSCRSTPTDSQTRGLLALESDGSDLFSAICRSDHEKCVKDETGARLALRGWLDLFILHSAVGWISNDASATRLSSPTSCILH